MDEKATIASRRAVECLRGSRANDVDALGNEAGRRRRSCWTNCTKTSVDRDRVSPCCIDITLCDGLVERACSRVGICADSKSRSIERRKEKRGI